MWYSANNRNFSVSPSPLGCRDAPWHVSTGLHDYLLAEFHPVFVFSAHADGVACCIFEEDYFGFVAGQFKEGSAVHLPVDFGDIRPVNDKILCHRIFLPYINRLFDDFRVEEPCHGVLDGIEIGDYVAVLIDVEAVLVRALLGEQLVAYVVPVQILVDAGGTVHG